MIFGKKYFALVKAGQLSHDLPMKLQDSMFHGENGPCKDLMLIPVGHCADALNILPQAFLDTLSIVTFFSPPRGYGEVSKRP